MKRVKNALYLTVVLLATVVALYGTGLVDTKTTAVIGGGRGGMPNLPTGQSRHGGTPAAGGQQGGSRL